MICNSGGRGGTVSQEKLQPRMDCKRRVFFRNHLVAQNLTILAKGSHQIFLEKVGHCVFHLPRQICFCEISTKIWASVRPPPPLLGQMPKFFWKSILTAPLTPGRWWAGPREMQSPNNKSILCFHALCSPICQTVALLLTVGILCIVSRYCWRQKKARSDKFNT